MSLFKVPLQRFLFSRVMYGSFVTPSASQWGFFVGSCQLAAFCIFTKPRLRIIRAVPRLLRWTPSLCRYPSLGWPSARRKDLSLDTKFAPALVVMSCSTELSSSSRCCRSTLSVLGGMLLIVTFPTDATFSVATCRSSLKCSDVASMLISRVQSFVPAQITMFL